MEQMHHTQNYDEHGLPPRFLLPASYVANLCLLLLPCYYNVLPSEKSWRVTIG